MKSFVTPQRSSKNCEDLRTYGGTHPPATDGCRALCTYLLFVHVPCLLLLVILAFVSHLRCLHKHLQIITVISTTSTTPLVITLDEVIRVPYKRLRGRLHCATLELNSRVILDCNVTSCLLDKFKRSRTAITPLSAILHYPLLSIWSQSLSLPSSACTVGVVSDSFSSLPIL